MLEQPPNWILWIMLAFVIFEIGMRAGELIYWAWKKWRKK